MTIARGSKMDIAALHGLYFLATGVWPLLSRRSFERVSGPKADFWLAQTVGILVAGVGSTILQAKRHGRITPEIELLGIASAAGLGSSISLLSPGAASRGSTSSMRWRRRHSWLDGSGATAPESFLPACWE